MNTQVQVPNLSGLGDSLVGVSNDGELFNSSFDPSVINDNRALIIDNANQINQNIQQINNNASNISKNRNDINKLMAGTLESATPAKQLSAMGQAFRALRCHYIPSTKANLMLDQKQELSGKDAIAGGCAARIKDSSPFNGAIAKTPT